MNLSRLAPISPLFATVALAVGGSGEEIYKKQVKSTWHLPALLATDFLTELTEFLEDGCAAGAVFLEA